ncbi:predicted protein [Verticillium alfalfae VaMs.102]|uniref:Predicted protein n=1 Tax=Verticillium alfalfae (strain VaMs.102 / ATCC MYA-4576 / FGSC 10136) TaxID=526221 RepID=C9SRF2_VERA1|nr:predicted protein [Verticillium alfalfae VaMs.102]EEY21367.1 predicted protein [Verticillium alfalfae VaMs.102]
MFHHRPLSEARREIRLIRFVVAPSSGPPSEEAPIALELCHVSLDEDPEYGALSYVWGDMRETLEATVDGRSYAIGRNLHGLFLQLRRQNVTRSTRRSHAHATPASRTCSSETTWTRMWIIQESPRYPVTPSSPAATPRCLCLCSTAALGVIWACKRTFRPALPRYRAFAAAVDEQMLDVRALNTRADYHAGVSLMLLDILYIRDPAPGRPYYAVTDPRDVVFAILGIVSDGEALGLQVDYTKTRAHVFATLTRALIMHGDSAYGSFGLDSVVPRAAAASDDLPSWVVDWQAMGMRGTPQKAVRHQGLFGGWCDATRGGPGQDGTEQPGDTDSGLLRQGGCRVDVVAEVLRPPTGRPCNKCMPPALCERCHPDLDWSAVEAFARLDEASKPNPDWGATVSALATAVTAMDPVSVEHMARIEAPKVFRLVSKMLLARPIAADALDDTEAALFRDDVYGYWSSAPAEVALTDENIAEFADALRRHWAACLRGRTFFWTEGGRLGICWAGVQAGDVLSLVWNAPAPVVLGQRQGGGFVFKGDSRLARIAEDVGLRCSHDDDEKDDKSSRRRKTFQTTYCTSTPASVMHRYRAGFVVRGAGPSEDQIAVHVLDALRITLPLLLEERQQALRLEIQRARMSRLVLIEIRAHQGRHLPPLRDEPIFPILPPAPKPTLRGTARKPLRKRRGKGEHGAERRASRGPACPATAPPSLMSRGLASSWGGVAPTRPTPWPSGCGKRKRCAAMGTIHVRVARPCLSAHAVTRLSSSKRNDRLPLVSSKCVLTQRKTGVASSGAKQISRAVRRRGPRALRHGLPKAAHVGVERLVVGAAALGAVAGLVARGALRLDVPLAPQAPLADAHVVTRHVGRCAGRVDAEPVERGLDVEGMAVRVRRLGRGEVLADAQALDVFPAVAQHGVERAALADPRR